MTPEQLAEIKARVEVTTQDAWCIYSETNVIAGPNRGIATTGGYSTNGKNWDKVVRENAANAIFIANAHQDVPSLVAEVERLQAENASLLNTLKTVNEQLAEWSNEGPLDPDNYTMGNHELSQLEKLELLIKNTILSVDSDYLLG